MIIKKIKIEHFENIKSYSAKLNDEVNAFKGPYAYEMMIAIGGGLSYPIDKIGDFDKTRGEIGYITYDVDDIDEIERLNTNNILGANKEYMECSIFFNCESENYHRRLHQYLKVSDYYENNDFTKLTNNFGGTKVFRRYLHQYISDFKPVILFPDKDIEVYIDKEGFFQTRNINTLKVEHLSSQENTLFNLFCFNSLHEFWEGAAELRSLGTLKMPLLIGNVLEHLDFDYEKYEKNLKLILNTKSQVLFFTSSDIDNVPFKVHNICD